VKISVFIPSERYLDTAGVRIRYNRISAPLAELGWTLRIIPIDNAPHPSEDDSQVYLFSKCQDARALVLATAAKSAGIVTGIDLFDDYFSQEQDSRFATQRLWLQSMARHTRFFLCSTPRMLDVGNSYFGRRAGHLLPDPYEQFAPDRLERELDSKIRKAQRERRVPVLWFGMADNPNFPVGLHDLAAFGEALRPFQANGYSATLTILTNTKAIDGRVLEQLRRLPLPFVIREWSKKREEEALSQSLVSFIPANFQQFSTAKSLNRGVSALVGGTQLLTAGFPLYESLRDFVYDDAAILIEDLESSNLKLSPGRVKHFSKWITKRADAATQAQRLVTFLGRQIKSEPKVSDEECQWAVLHGAKSAASVSLLAQRLGWLSLGSPLSPGGMKCDAHLGYFGADPDLRFRVSQTGLEQLPEELRVAAVWANPQSGKGPPWEVPLEPSESEFPLRSVRRPMQAGTCAHAALDTEIMALTRTFFTTVFERLCIVGSELDPVRNNLRGLEQA
jgi:hypothetical protein